MKITCLIDYLDSGGAQRQMCMLASLLKERGYDVEVLTYFPQDFFAYMLKEAQVPHRVILWKNKFERIFAVRKALRHAKPEVVISYLETPSVMAELATIPDRPFKLIVSERNTTLKPGFKDKIYYSLHRFADAVVPNSYSQQKVLEKEAPYLKNKIHTITNCVDLNQYSPADTHIQNNPLQILVLARFEPQKNALGLAEALRIIRERRPDIQHEIHWHGRYSKGNNEDLFNNLKKKIEQYSLKDTFLLFEPVQDVLPLYHQSDAVCMPSFYEGCSNVIAEAMACGKPILAGNVCDNPMLVTEKKNGFLFDPNNPTSIADAIIKFSELSVEAKNEMSKESRRIVESLLSPERCVEKYIDVIHETLEGAS